MYNDMYFVTGLNFVLQQPSTAILAKTKADIEKKSSYSYLFKTVGKMSSSCVDLKTFVAKYLHTIIVLEVLFLHVRTCVGKSNPVYVFLNQTEPFNA